MKYCTTLRMNLSILLNAKLAQVAERQRWTRRVLKVHPSVSPRGPGEHRLFFSVITVWFPYRRWLLLVILNLPAAIAVGAVLTIIYPATAITMWTDLHCQHLSC